MARKKSLTPYQDVALSEDLERWGRASMDGDVADWGALDSLPFGELVGVLVASDAGLMLRAAEQRSAVAVGMFLGGQKRWQTCRDQRELLAVLESAVELLQRAAGAQAAPMPTPPVPSSPGAPQGALRGKGAKRPASR